MISHRFAFSSLERIARIAANPLPLLLAIAEFHHGPTDTVDRSILFGDGRPTIASAFLEREKKR